jgi:hypothetical protein
MFLWNKRLKIIPIFGNKVPRNEKKWKQNFQNLMLGKDIVFRFIIEYSSLRDFDPKVIGLFLYEDFWKMIFWLVLKLEITYRVIIS